MADPGVSALKKLSGLGVIRAGASDESTVDAMFLAPGPGTSTASSAHA
ncbi:MAG: hypothetical protein ABI343_21035 [Burkholderiaceae bacterium]